MVVTTSVPGWFITGADNYPARTGNAVRAQVDGVSSFSEITRMLRTATQRGHYIYLVGWWTQLDFELVPGDSSSTLRRLLGDAAQRNVQVRAILWSGHGPMASDNTTAGDYLNGLG